MIIISFKAISFLWIIEIQKFGESLLFSRQVYENISFIVESFKSHSLDICKCDIPPKDINPDIKLICPEHGDPRRHRG